MSDRLPVTTGEEEDLLLEIVETLAAHGLEPASYRLADTLDVEALRALLSNSDGDPKVRVTVEGYRLQLTADGVWVIDQPSTD